MKRLARLLIKAGAIAALYAAVYMAVTRNRRRGGRVLGERRAVPDLQSLEDAGLEDPIGVDLAKLTDMKSASYRPLQDYLTAIRVKRGSDESLLFVRKRDVDALASLIGTSPEEFLENFRQMGVVVSLN